MSFLDGYKTWIGIAITVIGSLAGVLGYDLGDLTGVQNSLIALIGAVVATYGHYVTKRGA